MKEEGVILGSSNLRTGLFIAPTGAGFTRSPITEIYGPPLPSPVALSPRGTSSLSRRSPLFHSLPSLSARFVSSLRSAAIRLADAARLRSAIGRAHRPERINAD